MTSRFLLKLAVLGAILMHFGLAASGLIGELPLEIRPDEADIVERAARILFTGDPNPRFFHHPAGPHLYAHVTLFAAFHAVSGTAQTFNEHFLAARPTYYLLSRILGVAFTTLSVAAVFALGRATFSCLRTAALSAWCAAASPLLIAYSAYARAEASSVLFMLVSVYHSVQLWRCLSSKRMLLSAVFAGLAFGNRYLLAFLVGYVTLTPLVIGWLKAIPFKRTASLALTSLALSLVVFLVSNPFIFFDLATLEGDLLKQARSMHLGADGLTPIGNFVWYLTNTLPEGLTPPQVALAVIGMARTLVKRDQKGVWIALFPLGYLAAISALSLHWHRWALPALPCLSLLAGLGSYWLWGQALTDTWRPPVRIFARRLITSVLLSWMILVSSAYAVWRSLPSTRQQAGVWMAANLPAGSNIYQQGYGALVPDGLFELRGLYIRIPSVAEFAERGADYVVLSSAVYGRVMAEPARYPVAVNSTLAFMQEATLLRAFHPPRECHVELMVTLCGGPTLLIYQISRSETP